MSEHIKTVTICVMAEPQYTVSEISHTTNKIPSAVLKTCKRLRRPMRRAPGQRQSESD